MALQMHAIRHLRRADHPVSSRLVVEGPGVCGSGLTAALRNGMQVVGYASAESHYLRAKVRDERLAQAPRGLEEGEGEGARARDTGPRDTGSISAFGCSGRDHTILQVRSKRKLF